MHKSFFATFISWLAISFTFALLANAQMVPHAPVSHDVGVLLMAHGGSKEWNDQVLEIGSQVNASLPTEVAFGMANRNTLQAEIDKLKKDHII